jgi:two-component system OmpR family response regulator
MPRILVVDDEPRITSFVSRALSAEGFGVDGALDGARALELLRSADYDLVVLDLLLPDADGFVVLQQIVRMRPHQRVLVLSALSDVDARVRSLDLGAEDYLAKPFALAELLARVRARVRRDGAAPAERYVKAGRVTLDVHRRVAQSGDGPTALSEREFLLLQRLMRANGDVCSRERLLAEVWGYSFDPGSNVVDVYVGRLRAKLGSDLIETVRGVGYRLEAS